jgi:hypothetical protein
MTQDPCSFTYAHFRRIFESALENGYQVVTLAEYFAGDYDAEKPLLVNRMDVDLAPDRLWEIGGIFRELGIRGSFYFRLHAPQYNLLRFDTIAMVRWLAEAGNEIGLHAELMDLEGVCGVEPRRALAAELGLMRDVLGCEVVGAASHGDATAYNNLDFWKANPPADFGLRYEAYDERLWKACRYVSDSNYTWKAYDQGELRAGDKRCACRHFADGQRVVCVALHSDSYFRRYVHEGHVPASGLAGAGA